MRIQVKRIGAIFNFSPVGVKNDETLQLLLSVDSDGDSYGSVQQSRRLKKPV